MIVLSWLLRSDIILFHLTVQRIAGNSQIPGHPADIAAVFCQQRYDFLAFFSASSCFCAASPGKAYLPGVKIMGPDHPLSRWYISRGVTDPNL